MTTLKDWIRQEGEVISPEYLRVDGFLNHRISPAFVEEAGRELANAFKEAGVTCVLTAEAAGNVVAYEIARKLNTRALYAKKGRAATMVHPLVRAVRSPTKGTVTELMVEESGACLVGFGFLIEKQFGNGRKVLARFGVPVVSLVTVAEMDPESGNIMLAD